jgi:Zn-dependent peptidase ImmA (M78 family)
VIRKDMENGPEGALVRAGADLLLIVNSHKNRLARQRFTAAHEFGHALFDADGKTMLVDRDLFAPGRRETRANAFAVNLLIPLDEIRERRDSGKLNLGSNDALIRLSIEYGLSTQSLGYHLKNNGFIAERRRRELNRDKPLARAAALGYPDRVQQEFEARSATRWPGRYVELASRARERKLVDEQEWRDLLKGDDSVDRWMHYEETLWQ